MSVELPRFHYADCVQPVETMLTQCGWGSTDVVARLRDVFAQGGPNSRQDTELLEHLRDGVPELRGDADYRLPREIYEAVADRCQGESMFLGSRPGALQMGYGDLLDDVDEWAVDRFVGLGCPWIPGLPEAGHRTLDLGCGAGVDLAIAAHATGGTSFGIDRLGCLAARQRPKRGAVALGDARQCPFEPESFDLVVANGLPPLLGISTAALVLAEARRVLVPSGELRFVTLCVGIDEDLRNVDPQTLVDAVRCSKPHCAEYRIVLQKLGFGAVKVIDLRSPFVSSYRPGPVRSVLVRAWKDSA